MKSKLLSQDSKGPSLKESSLVESSPESTVIVIIGAGGGGAATALSLAKYGRIFLLDAREHVGAEEETKRKSKLVRSLSTSWINPGRAGHGFHYRFLLTCIMQMESTIRMHRKYSDIQVGATKPASHPLRRGRYFIDKDSQCPPEKLIELYTQLREHYRKLVAQDPKNQVLGDPDDFFRILKPEEYKDVVNFDRIVVGIETTEQLISPALLSQILFGKIKEQEKISLLPGAKVKQVCYGENKPFVVMLENGESIEADHVINCAWEGMEAIDQTLGLYDFSLKSTNRLKVLAQVKLPEELIDQHSMFFCMGPFCMFSNLGDGRGMLTYAPVTNVASYPDSKMDEMGRKMLAGEISLESLGLQIIKGVSQWIPAMAKAELIQARAGVVKVYGDVEEIINLDDPESPIHKRDYYGVDCKQVGFISNACMKFVNVDKNAELVEELFIQNLHAEQKIATMVKEVAKRCLPIGAIEGSSIVLPKLFRLCLKHYLRRNYLFADAKTQMKALSIDKKFPKSEAEKLDEKFSRQINQKNLLNTELALLPKDYPPSLMMMYLRLRKTLIVNGVAKVVCDYLEDSKSCSEEKTVDAELKAYMWYFWAPGSVYTSKPLQKKMAPAKDDAIILRSWSKGNRDKFHTDIFFAADRRALEDRGLLPEEKYRSKRSDYMRAK